MDDPTIEELLQAIEVVRLLKETLVRHEELISRIGDRLDSIEQRLSLTEKRSR